MGIPKLSQDLQQFAEPVVLGGLSTNQGTQSVNSLVIDGPSLVYYVFDRLLAIKSSRSPGLLESLPTYAEINGCALQMLSDLESHGVQIHNIYFDGGLPLAKRATRLDRLEKLRLQLVGLRKQNKHGFTIHRTVRLESLDYECALWQPVSQDRRVRSLLPPSFMIASVAEALQKSRWAHLTALVPGEADPYCAHQAKLLRCAILSNDSDMVVYDLGFEGSLVLLHSLQKVPIGVITGGPTRIVASRIQPINVCKQLRLSSFPKLAFERYLDPSLSLVAILNRARDPSRSEKTSSQFESFFSQYASLTTHSRLDLKLSQQDLIWDPRIAELVTQALGGSEFRGEAESLKMYLPFLFEDPSRDPAWSYGRNFRQIAYSIIGSMTSPRLRLPNVSEIYRRGNRIGEFGVKRLEGQILDSSAGKIYETLRRDLEDLPKLTTNLSRWRAVAFRELQRLKFHNEKPLISEIQIRRQFNMENWSGQDDIHITACLEAALYSLRSLSQVFQLQPPNQKQLTELCNLLQDLPPLAESTTTPGPLETQNNATVQPLVQYILRFQPSAPTFDGF